MSIKDFSIEELRGSVFAPQIAYNWESVSMMLKLLPSYIPSYVFTAPQILNTMIIQPDEWFLVSPNHREMLIFHSQKIDFIVHTPSEIYSETIISNFADRCQKIFEEIFTKKELKATRIAIAPTCKYMGNKSQCLEFVNGIYSKNNFMEANVGNFNFSQVFRVEEKILNNSYKINYLSKFFVKSSIVNENGINKIQEDRMLNLDINTFENPKYSFDVPTIKDFFAQSSSFCSNFMNFYFEEK